MRAGIKIAVILLCVLSAGGLLVVAVSRVRHAAKRAECCNHLRAIGLALEAYQGCYGRFPPGTVPNPDLPPDKRLSWLTQLYPAFMEGGVASLLDTTRAWDDEGNCPPRCRVRGYTARDEVRWDEHPVGQLRVLQCPAAPSRAEPQLPCPTNYLGVAGLGERAAELPVSDPRAGLFGYDRVVRPRDLAHGAATTMAVAEAADGGPWTAGGRATVRGLVPGGQPYLGEGGQFTALHRDSNFLRWSPPVAINVLFADGSVHPFTASVSPRVFENLATIGGGGNGAR